MKGAYSLMTIDFCEQFRSLRLRDENLAKLQLLNDYVRLPNKKMPYSQIVIRANRQARVNQIPKLPHSDSPDSLVINRLHANLISIKLAHTSGQSRAYIPIYLCGERETLSTKLDRFSVSGSIIFFRQKELGDQNTGNKIVMQTRLEIYTAPQRGTFQRK